MSRWKNEGRKNHALKLNRFRRQKASGLTKHPSSVNTRKASPIKPSIRGGVWKGKIP